MKVNEYIQAMPGTSMVDDFKQSQDPIMKQGWVERFEPNFAKYKELGVGYSKYSFLSKMI